MIDFMKFILEYREVIVLVGVITALSEVISLRRRIRVLEGKKK